MRKLSVSLIFVLVLFSCKNEGKKESDKETTQMETTTSNIEGDNKIAATSGITLVSPEEAERLMQLGNTQLVDVRTEEELKQGKIEGAVSMIYQKNFKEKIANLDKSEPVLVYCHSGRRSAKCAEILKNAGFEKIYDLDGGITQWKRDGKPLVKP